MKDIRVQMDRSGRIVLPKTVRQELGLEPGDLFKVSVRGAGVTLVPEKQTGGFVRKGKALVFTSRSGATLSRNVTNTVLRALREKRFAESLRSVRQLRQSGA